MCHLLNKQTHTFVYCYKINLAWFCKFAPMCKVPSELQIPAQGLLIQHVTEEKSQHSIKVTLKQVRLL